MPSRNVQASGFSLVEMMVALGLCGATALVVASVMSLIAQNRATNQRDRRILNAQNALTRVFGSSESCNDAVRAAASDAAAGVQGVSAWTLGASTLTMTRVRVASMPSTSAGTSGLTYSDAFVRKGLAAADSSIYARDIYLANPALNSDGTYYYQAFADLVTPPPPVSGSSFAEALAPRRRPVLIGTVQLQTQSGQIGCYSPPQAGSASCATPGSVNCRPNTVAVAYDPATQALTCVPIARGCYVGATVGGVRRALHERVVFTGQACAAGPPTGATPLPAGVACDVGTTRTSNLHNCAFDAVAGAWSCSVWCALMNCTSSI